MDSKLKFEKLSSTNYFTWQNDIMSALDYHDLGDFVKGNGVIPPANSSSANYAEELAKYKRNKNRALAIIKSGLSAQFLYLIDECEDSPLKLFTSIVNHCNKKNASNINALKTKFIMLKMKPGESFKEYFGKKMELVSLLRNASQKIPEDEVVINIIAGLSSQYESIGNNLIMSETTPSAERVYEVLTNFESKLSVKQSNRNAFSAKVNQSNALEHKEESYVAVNVTCKACSGKGHNKMYVPQNKYKHYKKKHFQPKQSFQNPKPTSSKFSKPFSCKVANDLSDSDSESSLNEIMNRMCTKDNSDNITSNDNISSEEEELVTVSERVFHTHNKKQPEKIIIDSGASRHCFNNKQFFRD